jgi:predicted negative regulator of RcsB-dependent stress response
LASYHSDEEQLEALKRWWHENGRSVMAGVIIGVGALLGWRGWVAYHENQAEAASIYYAALRAAVTREDAKAIEKNAEILKDSFASTPYALLAALALAKLEAQAGDLKGSEAQLGWAIDHSSQDVVRTLAKIRLARLLTAQGRYDEALATVTGDFPAAYTSLVEEIRGDALVGKGQIEKARAAYDRAIVTATGNIEYLRMKRADLGEAKAPRIVTGEM